MALKPIYELNTTSDLHEDHDILVYQDNKLKKLNSKDIFYSKDYIDKNIIEKKNDIVEALAALHVDVNDDSSLWDIVNAIDDIDLFEIGTRRLVHDGTDTTNLYPDTDKNSLWLNNTGEAQTEPDLDRVYKIGDVMTIIPKIAYDNRNPNTDFLFAGYSSASGIVRNDFYGGKYTEGTISKFQNGIYPWNKMRKVQILENNIYDETAAEYNYDMSIDNGGNYFTEIPLYFIKTEIKTEDGIDISNTWPKIPNEYITKNVYEYNFVCKAKLEGYRPAEFFYSYISYYTMEEDVNGEYIYIEDLDCYYRPYSYGNNKRYKKVYNEEFEDDPLADKYIKILDNKHYFGCYEGTRTNMKVTDTLNTYTLSSRPGSIFNRVEPKSIFNVTRINNYVTNMSPYEKCYSSLDTRTYYDFILKLMEIEFATTNIRAQVFGVDNSAIGTNISNIESYEIQLMEIGLLPTDDCLQVGQKIKFSTKNPEQDDGVRLLIGKRYDTIEYEGEVYDVVYYKLDKEIESQQVVTLNTYDCGYTDTDYIIGYTEDENGTYRLVDNKYEVITDDNYNGVRYKVNYSSNGVDFRSGISNFSINGNESQSYPFKWNWIENPFGNTPKLINGVFTYQDTVMFNNDSSSCIKYHIISNPNKYVANNMISNTGPVINGTITSIILSNRKPLYNTFDTKFPWARFPYKFYTSENLNYEYVTIRYKSVFSNGFFGNYYQSLYSHSSNNNMVNVNVCTFLERRES